MRDASSQVVLNGKVWKNLKARDYYEHSDFLLRLCAGRIRAARCDSMSTS